MEISANHFIIWATGLIGSIVRSIRLHTSLMVVVQRSSDLGVRRDASKARARF